MNPLDWVILSILGLGVCIGLLRGFVKEAVSTVGILLAAYAANWVSPHAQAKAGDIIGNQSLANVLVWIVVFMLAMFVLKGVSYLLVRVIRAISLGWLNRILGGVFAGIKYSLILALVVYILEFADRHINDFKIAAYLHTSVFVPWLHKVADSVWKMF